MKLLVATTAALALLIGTVEAKPLKPVRVKTATYNVFVPPGFPDQGQVEVLRYGDLLLEAVCGGPCGRPDAPTDPIRGWLRYT
jgi:hypothetical protein